MMVFRLSRRQVLGAAAAMTVAGRSGTPPGRTRTYFLAADPVTWNYVPQNHNLITGHRFTPGEQKFTTPGPKRLGGTLQKAQYRQYADATFTTLVRRPPQEAYLGLLGPVVRAEAGDTIRVVCKNNTSFPVSVHPHGVFYTTANEGAPTDDGTGDQSRGAIPPGATYPYTWQVPDRAGPGPNDPSSIGWLYHDHATGMGVPGGNAGLVGAIVITRCGAARPDATPVDVDREVFVLFTEFDENESPYLQDNIARYAPGQHIDPAEPDFRISNRKSAINGYLFGNGPEGTAGKTAALTMRQGERVRWYVFGVGSEQDLHSPHWHGNTVLVSGRRTDVVNLLPGTAVTADMRPDDPGIWQLHCHVSDHMTNGMTTRYEVR